MIERIRPKRLGVGEGTVSGCSGYGNCVSSLDGGYHRVSPLTIVGSEQRSWDAAVESALASRRTTVIRRTERYLHVERRLPIVPFVDDLELELIPGEGRIEVRSASRIGTFDFFVNRLRVWRLRRMFRSRILLADQT